MAEKARASRGLFFARLKSMSKKITRCRWAEGVSLNYIRYHDEEWGVPVRDDRTQFEFLVLEGAQAGLSWSTILNKRDGYRRAFADFDPAKVARFTAKRIEKLLRDPAIVRNRLKVRSAVTNAQAFLAVQEEFGSFSNYIWGFVDGRPVQNRFRRDADVPATSPVSDALSKDLKQRGFKFVGSTIVYAHMQATGIVNDHVVGCFRHRPCARLGRAT
jgi:DNA-3-methyladenine glycosylase I